MQLDLGDDEPAALIGELDAIVTNDCYPLSPRIEALRAILVKFGEMGGLPPDLTLVAWCKDCRHQAEPDLAAMALPPPKVYGRPSKVRYRRR